MARGPMEALNRPTPGRGRPGGTSGKEAGGRDRTDGHLITSEVLYH